MVLPLSPHVAHKWYFLLSLSLISFLSISECFTPHHPSSSSSSPQSVPQTLRQRPIRLVSTTIAEDASRSANPSTIPTPILDKVRFPKDLKSFSEMELKQLCTDIRNDLLSTVSKTGGHLSSSLGVVELAVALHYVFDTPEDRVIWDVSHQAYPHKILTGRREKMMGIRQKGGISGFAKRSESVYDCFGAGHSSTSISAAQGMSVGRSMLDKVQNNCIAVIGDGSITGGMAYEAMNNCGFLKSRLIVVLNDNGQVSLPTGCNSAGGTAPIGALSQYTARLLSSKSFKTFREVAKSFSKLLPEPIQDINAKIDEYARGLVSGEKATLFEELGFYYVGPVDGHDLSNLIPMLKNFKESDTAKPILLHIKTEKGSGYAPALKAADKMHGVVPFDVESGKQFKGKGKPSYTSLFAETLIDLAEKDPKVVAITAAMPGGTGVGEFGARFPERTFDVGIAEQHAVTFAAGLATEGIKPFVAIYSTFLQRAYDQVIHDCVLQGLPVRFIIDRAGMVGADGATHHGTFDLAYLGALPNLVIMAPAEEVELKHMIQTAYELDSTPSALRYPRGNAEGMEKLRSIYGYTFDELPKTGTALPIGKGRVMKTAKGDARHKVALLSIGTRLGPSIEAARQLEEENPDISVTVADARFMRPLDEELIKNLAEHHDAMVTIEEGSIGGFGDHVLHYLSNAGILDKGKCKVRSLVLPDVFIEAGTQTEQYAQAGLDTPNIVKTVKNLTNENTPSLVSSAASS